MLISIPIIDYTLDNTVKNKGKKEEKNLERMKAECLCELINLLPSIGGGGGKSGIFSLLPWSSSVELRSSS